jgi:lysozyme family protein
MNRDQIISATIQHEGGDKFTNDPNDPGHATKFGITRMTLSVWRKETCTAQDVEALTEEEARAIYQDRYWNAVRGDDLPPPLAVLVFDTAVTHGPTNAVKFLQRALGNLTIDGQLGPKTIRAVRSRGDREVVFFDFVVARVEYWQSRGHAQHYIRGWWRRALSNLTQALAVADEAAAGVSSGSQFEETSDE